MYGVSKLCEATYTRLLAKELQARRIDVNACCPGYVATDMSSWRGQKTAVSRARASSCGLAVLLLVWRSDGYT